MGRAPLSDAIIVALARLVDDAQVEPSRAPTHYDIQVEIERAGLRGADPNASGRGHVGKRKRVETTLSWAFENKPEAGEKLVAGLVSRVKGLGGFRETSPNFVGRNEIETAAAAFREEGFELASNGELRALALEVLSGADLTAALRAYVRRAQRGIEDAALVAGTSKDLLEATAAHVLFEHYGKYSTSANFPTLLGQAFAALGLATPEHPQQPGEPAQRRFERAMYELGCAINKLRNKEGTGHGRPWLSSISDSEARVALELMGSISERLLLALEEQR